MRCTNWLKLLTLSTVLRLNFCELWYESLLTRAMSPSQNSTSFQVISPPKVAHIHTANRQMISRTYRSCNAKSYSTAETSECSRIAAPSTPELFSRTMKNVAKLYHSSSHCAFTIFSCLQSRFSRFVFPKLTFLWIYPAPMTSSLSLIRI